LWLSRYQNGGDKELSAPLLPVLFVLFLAYTVSTIFLNAYGLAIDTILLCFCEDKKVRSPYAMLGR
jgi:choline transporter-like protein 2/4/5